MRVAIIGGTGFVGSYLVDALLAAGHTVAMLVRPGSEHKIRNAERLHVVPGDIGDHGAIGRLLGQCDAVIYNVGILRESPRQGITYEATQFAGAAATIGAAVHAGVRRLVLMSANGVKVPGTPYQETKFRAESCARQSGLDVTVFRPSVIFGDPRGAMEFATQLYRDMVRPPIPAINFFSGMNAARGAVLMSPVHIVDVADAFVAALHDDATIGETYALGGPEVLTWRQMISRIAAATGRRKWFLPMPIGLMRVAATLLDRLPLFPVTRDQLTMLAEGNTADPTVIERLIGRAPKPFSSEALAYLAK